MIPILMLHGLYIGKPVLVTFDDGHMVEGVFQGLSGGGGEEESSLLIDTASYPAEAVADLEFTADVIFYYPFRGFGELQLPNGTIAFSADDLENKADLERLCHCESHCRMAGHLYMKTCRGLSVFHARHLRVIRETPYTAYDELYSRSYLYLLKDGSAVIGQLLESDEQSFQLLGPAEQEYSADWDEVRQILRAPTLGDYIIAELKDGETAEGVVTISEPELVLLVPHKPEELFRVRYEQIERMRWAGTLHTRTHGDEQTLYAMIGNDADADAWLCQPKCCEDYDSLTDNLPVSFLPIISRTDKVACQVTSLVANREPLFHGYGAIIVIPHTETERGWIGNTCATSDCRQLHKHAFPKGNVSFSSSLLPFPLQGNMFYVVEYTCARDPALQPQNAISMKILKEIPREPRSFLHVEADGSWHIERIEKISLGCSLAQWPEDLVNSQPMGILHLLSGESMPVRLLYRTASHASFLVLNEAEQTIKKIPLVSIHLFQIYGKITHYIAENGYGHIGSVWFHVSDVTSGGELLSEGAYALFSLKKVFRKKQLLFNAFDIHVEMPDTHEGWISAYDPMTKHCSLWDLQQDIRNTAPEGCTALPGDSQLEKDLYRCSLCPGIGFRACWNEIRLCGHSFVEPLWISLDESIPVPSFGCLMHWSEGAGQAFICPPDQLAAGNQLLPGQEALCIPVSNEEIQSALMEKSLLCAPPERVFAVLYDREEDQYGTVSAVNLRILYALKEPAQPAPQPMCIPPQSDIPRDRILDLTPYMAEGEEFGLIPFCSTNLSKIRREFEVGVEPEERDVLFSPKTITFLPGKRLNTSKMIYLVRYQRGGEFENTTTGEMYPSVVPGTTITVLGCYNRYRVKRLALSEDGTALSEQYHPM